MDDGRVISTNENQSHVVTVPPRPQAHGYPRATTQQPQPQTGYHHGYQQPPQHQYQGPPQGPSFGAMPSAPPPEEQPYPPAGHSGYGGMNPPPGAYYGEPPPPYSESELPPAKPPVKSWIYFNWRRLFRSLEVFQNIFIKILVLLNLYHYERWRVVSSRIKLKFVVCTPIRVLQSMGMFQDTCICSH